MIFLFKYHQRASGCTYFSSLSRAYFSLTLNAQRYHNARITWALTGSRYNFAQYLCPLHSKRRATWCRNWCCNVCPTIRKNDAMRSWALPAMRVCSVHVWQAATGWAVMRTLRRDSDVD
jgi:hypothetical protein